VDTVGLNNYCEAGDFEKPMRNRETGVIEPNHFDGRRELK